jgi:hypothetical protein
MLSLPSHQMMLKKFFKLFGKIILHKVDNKYKEEVVKQENKLKSLNNKSCKE